jgi:hypothetical protein
VLLFAIKYPALALISAHNTTPSVALIPTVVVPCRIFSSTLFDKIHLLEIIGNAWHPFK